MKEAARSSWNITFYLHLNPLTWHMLIRQTVDFGEGAHPLKRSGWANDQSLLTLCNMTTEGRVEQRSVPKRVVF